MDKAIKDALYIAARKLADRESEKLDKLVTCRFKGYKTVSPPYNVDMKEVLATMNDFNKNQEKS